MDELTPRQVVDELDKYIISQDEAKKAVAIALRNRYRRERLTSELKDEVIPKNILMIGATGIGKTEIARRLAKLANAPFIKVEATRFTEVGYVGRDVESMIRELVEISVQMVKKEKMEGVRKKAEEVAEETILDILQSKPKTRKIAPSKIAVAGGEEESPPPLTTSLSSSQPLAYEYTHQIERIRERLRKQLAAGKLDDRAIEIEVEESKFPVVEIFAGSGIEEMGINFQDMLGGMMPRKKKKRKATIKEAKRIIANEEMQKLIDLEAAVKEGIFRVEQKGIVFLDELDKVAGRERGHGPDVSREGVQRDLLPIIEGSTVMTKYGVVKTEYILFIAAGAFTVSKPSDLIPELQGRFPIRVELENLTEKDFQKILLEPRNALIKQYIALLETEGIKIEFTKEAILEIASIAAQVNEQTENIGARRLHTVLEKLLEDISFKAPEIEEKEIIIDPAYVKKRLAGIVKDEDLSRYIL